jgi:stage V sporulation protein R
MQAIFEAREVDRDVSFLRRFLTEEMMREMDMFQYEPRGDEMVISKVADKDSWRDIKETLIKNVGMGSIPSIKIEDADYNHNRVLYLKHYHDGRDLQLEYAERTLSYLNRLWRHEVILETAVNGKKVLLSYSEKGFSTKPLK